MEISHGLLHATILQFIIDKGFAPDVDELASLLKVTTSEIEAALESLADYHGVVLHPNSKKIWVIHPFSLAQFRYCLPRLLRSRPCRAEEDRCQKSSRPSAWSRIHG